MFFCKETQILDVLRNSISVPFYRKFATIFWKKMTFEHVNNRCWLVYASSIGSYRAKNGPIWEENFAFIVLRIWRKKIVSQMFNSKCRITPMFSTDGHPRSITKIISNKNDSKFTLSVDGDSDKWNKQKLFHSFTFSGLLDSECDI